jgi:hypothetical protein
MKNKFNFNILFILAAVLFWYGCAATKTTSSRYVGNWDYVVRNLPDGDVNGIMTISQEGDAYKGDIKSDDGSISISMQDLKIEDDKLTSYFYFQGMKIDMAGDFDGGNFTGSISVDYNQFPMTAQKVN